MRQTVWKHSTTLPAVTATPDRATQGWCQPAKQRRYDEGGSGFTLRRWLLGRNGGKRFLCGKADRGLLAGIHRCCRNPAPHRVENMGSSYCWRVPDDKQPSEIRMRFGQAACRLLAKPIEVRRLTMISRLA